MLIRHRSGLIPSSEGKAGKVSSEQEEEEDEEEAYTKAQKIRKESMQYGRLAFGEMDSGRGADIILEWTKARSGRKEELEFFRPKKVKGRGRVKEKENDKGTDKGKGNGKERENGKGKGKQASKGIGVQDKSSVSIVDLTEDAEPIVSSQVIPADEEEEVDELDSESDIEIVQSPSLAKSIKGKSDNAKSVSSHSSPVERQPLAVPHSSLAKAVMPTAHKPAPMPTAHKPAPNGTSGNNAPIPVSLSDLFSDDEDVIHKKAEKKSDQGEKKRKRDCRSESESDSSDSTITAVPASSRIRKESSDNDRLQAVKTTSSTKSNPTSTVTPPRSNSGPKSIQRAGSWRKSTTPLMSLSQNSMDDYGGDFDISSQELKRLDGIMA